MKILIADDDALSRRLLEKTLERAGYEVTAVEDGKQTEQLCKLRDSPGITGLGHAGVRWARGVPRRS